LWVAVPELVVVELEAVALVMDAEGLLVQLVVGSPVVHVVVDLVRVSADDVVTSFELVDEVVELELVDPVVGQIDESSLLVLLVSLEEFDNGVGFPVGIDLDLVGEGFVVETLLSNLYLKLSWTNS
jgi:hypothetical protein